jgi:hypothetical protein
LQAVQALQGPAAALAPTGRQLQREPANQKAEAQGGKDSSYIYEWHVGLNPPLRLVNEEKAPEASPHSSFFVRHSLR